MTLYFFKLHIHNSIVALTPPLILSKFTKKTKIEPNSYSVENQNITHHSVILSHDIIRYIEVQALLLNHHTKKFLMLILQYTLFSVQIIQISQNQNLLFLVLLLEELILK